MKLKQSEIKISVTIASIFLVSWNYGFHNSICSSKERFISHEVVKEEEVGRGSFEFTYKTRFEGDTAVIEEFIKNIWDKTGRKFLKEAKILESLCHPNVVNFSYVY